jgi:nucleoside-diphosphate-sugar epimerase
MVTGGAGFVGCHLAERLSESGNRITIIDNLYRGRADETFNRLISKENVEFINADMTKRNFCALLAPRYDEIYHLTAINGTKNFYEIPEKVLEVNILSLMNILDWVNEKNCGKFLFSSSSEAYAGAISEFGAYRDMVPSDESIPLVVNDVFNPRFSYGGSKIIGEILTINYLRQKSVRFSIIRYHNIYGPRMGFDHVIPEFCQRIMDGVSPFPVYGGHETRAFCYVDDGVEATKLVMESENADGGIVHIGNDREEISIIDMAKLLFEVTGYDAELAIRDAPAGSVRRRCPNIGKLAGLTGFSPKVPLREGLSRTYGWYEGNRCI